MPENKNCKRCGATLSPDAASAVYCADCWTELTSNDDLLDSNPFAARSFSDPPPEPFESDADAALERKIPTGPISAFAMQKWSVRGRASRAEFWLWAFAAILLGVAIFVVGVVAPSFYLRETLVGGVWRHLGTAAFVAFCALEFGSGLAVLARRLHDRDLSARSVWFLAVVWGTFGALLLVELVCLFWAPKISPRFNFSRDFLLSIWGVCLVSFAFGAATTPIFLLWAALPGTDGPNRFGPAPRREEKRKKIE